MTGELQFIDLVRTIVRDQGARGLSDDAATLRVGDQTLVLTHDMMVEGRHWAKDADPADVGWKIAAVNLSDLAAKGARPVAFLLGYMLGDDDWDRRFVEGLGEALDAFDVALLGGDTVSGPKDAPRAIGITAIGRATATVPARSGAKAGDGLFLIGSIGEAMAGHELGLRSRDFPALHAAFHRPRPLIEEGCMLGGTVHAMMDVSDGLLLDAGRMADASGLTVDIESEAVPIGDELQGWIDERSGEERDRRMRGRLGWGDDYALIFAAPEHFVPPVSATRVGRFLPRGQGAVMLDGTVPPDDLRMGYLHED